MRTTTMRTTTASLVFILVTLAACARTQPVATISGRYAMVGHDSSALGASTGEFYDVVFDGGKATLYHQDSDAVVTRVDFHLIKPGMYDSNASNFRNLEVVSIARPGKEDVQGLRVLLPYCYDYLVPVEGAR